MVETIHLSSRGGCYDILVGEHILHALSGVLASASPDGIAVITHRKLLEWYGKELLGAIRAAGPEPIVLTVPAGERSKSYGSAGALCEKLSERGLGRQGVIVAFGGGVIGDLAGFVASVYHRGIRYVQVPTTVLAQVDASVGGKVGVDLEAGKNLVGSFLQPLAVIADTTVLRTLPIRHLRNGMAEVLKYGFIFSAPFVDFVVGVRRQVERRDPTVLAEIVAACCRYKAEVVGEDERDTTGSRARLNFGHTVAHAIETSLGYRSILHGEAVAIGMVAEARIARRLGLCDADVPEAVRTAVLAYSLGRQPPRLAPEELVALMYRDKKVVEGKLVMALPTRVGEVKLVGDVPQDVVMDVLREMDCDG
ncbi:MAG: 3-dehydroquinate synthase [Fimbriimonadales bacterium]